MKKWSRFAMSICMAAGVCSAQPTFAAEPVKAAGEDDPRKFYQFHRAGITAEDAAADYRYCSALSDVVMSNDDTLGYSTATGGGLLGGLIEGIQKGVEADRMKHATLRKCMAMFGYDRYLQSQPDFDAARTGADSVEKIAAAIAGPVPTTGRLFQ